MAAQTVTHKGKLTMLGNSRPDRGGSVYSVIEIGNDTIEDVLCFDKLDNYLHRALDHSGEVEMDVYPKPSKGEAMKALFGAFFSPKLIGIYIAISIVMFLMLGVVFIIMVLGLGFLGGLVLLSSLPTIINRPRYALIDAISIDGKRFSN